MQVGSRKPEAVDPDTVWLVLACTTQGCGRCSKSWRGFRFCTKTQAPQGKPCRSLGKQQKAAATGHSALADQHRGCAASHSDTHSPVTPAFQETPPPGTGEWEFEHLADCGDWEKQQEDNSAKALDSGYLELAASLDIAIRATHSSTAGEQTSRVPSYPNRKQLIAPAKHQLSDAAQLTTPAQQEEQATVRHRVQAFQVLPEFYLVATAATKAPGHIAREVQHITDLMEAYHLSEVRKTCAVPQQGRSPPARFEVRGVLHRAGKEVLLLQARRAGARSTMNVQTLAISPSRSANG